jgi:hypothetical protein
MLHLFKVRLVGCALFVWLMAGCSTPAEYKVVNQGEQAVELRGENENGVMNLAPGGTAYVHPNDSTVRSNTSSSIAFIADGGAGIKTLPNSSLWIDEIEVRIGRRFVITNPGPKVVHIKYLTADGQEQTLMIGENATGYVDAERPFRLNNLQISQSGEFLDR